MPINCFVRATIDHSSGWVTLRFGFNRELINLLKTVPGSRWDPDSRAWRVSIHGWSVISPHVKFDAVTLQRNVAIPEVFQSHLWPHQLEGASLLAKNAGFLLTFDMRTGKTSTAIAAACALFQDQLIDMALVLYPESVSGEWSRQLKQWANLDLVETERFDQADIDRIRSIPYLFLGANWESLGRREPEIAQIIDRRRFVVIGDEIHLATNPKAKRYQTLSRITAGQALVAAPSDDSSQYSAVAGQSTCVARWGLTGTPMRNRPANLYGVFNFITPGSMGGFGRYVQRYCGGELQEHGYHFETQTRVDPDTGEESKVQVQLPGHYDTKGESNMAELSTRLAAVSLRKTRAEVAGWLPRSEYRVIACQVPSKDLKRYRKLEQALAPTVRNALEAADPTLNEREALRQLAEATSTAKIPAAIERLQEHVARGSKIVCFAHFRETLKLLYKKICEIPPEDWTTPTFLAGGWISVGKRRQIIESWKTIQGPSILLANSLASGIGIDLSDAEAAIFLELEWVPSDFGQTAARIQDVHLGKRSTPPLYECLIVQGTVDEDMAGVLLQKVRAIESVVGKDAESSAITNALRDSGSLSGSNLSLPSTDKETVKAAIMGMRNRWLTDEEPSAEQSAKDDLVSSLSDWEDGTEESVEEASL